MNYDAEVMGEASIIAYWQLDDAGSTAEDAVSTLDGTYSGATVVTSDGPTADSGGYADFSGASTHHVVLPNNAALRPGNVTVEAWIRTPDPTANCCLWTGGDSPYNNLMVNGDLDCRVEMSVASGGQQLYTGDPRISANTWTLVAYTYDGTTLRIYQDGGLRNSVNPAGGGNASWASQAHRIGQRLNGGEPFGGHIAKVAIYGAALTGTRLQAHYDAKDTPIDVDPAPTLLTVQGALSYG